jgi:hypothetical protein
MLKGRFEAALEHIWELGIGSWEFAGEARRYF